MDQPFPTSDSVDFARVARLVRPFETLEPCAIRRPGGGWSIGYGHVSSARAGAQVTEDEAAALLNYDLRRMASSVRAAIYAPINRNQLEALTAFAFHIGTENFLHSTALHRFNAGDSLGAALEIERWCCADLDGEVQVVDALVRRRAAEKAHFLTPPEGFPKASRIRVRPQVDVDSSSWSAESLESGPSATLAAAHSVSARLRALVPDLADDPAPSALSALEVEAPAALETAVVPENEVDELQPSAAEAGQAFDAPEAEIPPPPMPPPMPQDDVRSIAPEPVAPKPAAYDVWPSFATDEVRLGDPFTLDPADAASIEAPPLDRSASTSSLFRAKPHHRVEISPRPERAPASSSLRAALTKDRRPFLLICLVIGAVAFVWSIWSIFKTSPSVLNFVVGLIGIAVMAVPAYLLLGANVTLKSSDK